MKANSQTTALPRGDGRFVEIRFGDKARSGSRMRALVINVTTEMPPTPLTLAGPAETLQYPFDPPPNQTQTPGNYVPPSSETGDTLI